VIAAVHEMKKADKSITIAAAMATFGLGPSFYIRWKKTCLDALEIMSEEQSRVTVHGGVRKLHPGCPSVLEPERAALVNAVERLGCDVLYIPGGCTYLCQPIDVGINRPFKRELKRQWEDWVEDAGTDLQAPSRRDVAEWVITAHAMIPTATVKSAWKKTGFSWE
jgi:hypothetical protein